MKLVDVFYSFNPYKDPITQPYIIAEAGVNHEGSMDIAKRLIHEAREGGAHAIKFQTYKAETLASRYSPAYWDITKEPTQSQYELFKKHDRFWKTEFEQLKITCDKEGIEFISTPFDIESTIFLNDLMDVFKIASSDITNKPFIEFICGFKKPIMLSTGASYLSEIEDAVRWIEDFKIPLALLHCMLNYPTDDSKANLGFLLTLKQKFPNRLIGYSDHTTPKDMKTLETAMLLGARIIEKHFTHDKTLQGNDHYHAMDKEDLKVFFNNIRRPLELIGGFDLGSRKDEISARKNARRSLIAKRDIAEGKLIEYEDLTWKRPAYGISPKFIDTLIGKRAKTLIKEDSILKWDMVEDIFDINKVEDFK